MSPWKPCEFPELREGVQRGDREEGTGGRKALVLPRWRPLLPSENSHVQM